MEDTSYLKSMLDEQQAWTCDLNNYSEARLGIIITFSL